MRPPAALRAALAGAALLLAVAAPAAPAATLGFDGDTLTYDAGPAEVNRVLVHVAPQTVACAPLAAPCMTVTDTGARITVATGRCVLTLSGIAGDTAVCPVPVAVRASLGDREDAWWDWDGPSTVDGGDGNDTPLAGAGGADALRGGPGDDVLLGGAGDDVLDGGQGADALEGVPSGVESGTDTGGADTYIGGPGIDALTLENRSEPLVLSGDGQANDGAAGEHDDVAPDVEALHGGTGDDTLAAGTAAVALYGGPGDDALTGGPGDDVLDGGDGADTLAGGDGQDQLLGQGGDDRLDGGAGWDLLWGDSPISSYGGRDVVLARDGERDRVHCGPGVDAGRVDRADEVATSPDDACETLDVARADPVPGPQIVRATPGAGGRIALRVRTAAGGRLVVTAAARVAGRTRRLAEARRVVRRAGTVRVVLAVPPAGLRMLRAGGAPPVTVRVVLVSGAGAASRAATAGVRLR